MNTTKEEQESQKIEVDRDLEAEAEQWKKGRAVRPELVQGPQIIPDGLVLGDRVKNGIEILLDQSAQRKLKEDKKMTGIS